MAENKGPSKLNDFNNYVKHLITNESLVIFIIIGSSKDGLFIKKCQRTYHICQYIALNTIFRLIVTSCHYLRSMFLIS